MLYKVLHTPHVSIPYETFITLLGAVEIHIVKLSKLGFVDEKLLLYTQSTILFFVAQTHH